MRSIFFLALVHVSLFSSGVTQAPQMLRACLNNDDSTLTIQWRPVGDVCASFTRYDLYANKNSGPYSRIARITNRLTTEHSYKLDDLSTDRNYYIVVHSLCDGLDSATSTVLRIDQTKPPQRDLKRVSFDTATQEVFAEWYRNPAPDAMGYRLYRYNTSVYDSIGQTTDTFQVVSPSPGVPFDVGYATFDSCLLFSPISERHRVAYMQGAIDTCARRITLSWTLYKGWSSIDSQALYMSINDGYFRRMMGFGGGISSAQLNGIQLGDTLCVYLVSYTDGSGTRIESFSNTLCFETRAFAVPELYLSNVTLDASTMTKSSAEWLVYNHKDVAAFDVYAAIGGGSFVRMASVPHSGQGAYQWSDPTNNPTASRIRYYIEAVNVCNESAAISLESTTIFLAPQAGAGSFNNYINWDGALDSYAIEFRSDQGSTWNSYGSQVDNAPFALKSEPGCYRVIAYETMNSHGIAATSYSNSICIQASLKIWAPETMVIGGLNNRFLVHGTGIDHSRSRFEIYNRWGQRIAEQPTDQAWYGDYGGDHVPTGLYPFVIFAYGFNGESEQINGVLRIIE